MSCLTDEEELLVFQGFVLCFFDDELDFTYDLVVLAFDVVVGTFFVVVDFFVTFVDVVFHVVDFLVDVVGAVFVVFDVLVTMERLRDFVDLIVDVFCDFMVLDVDDRVLICVDVMMGIDGETCELSEGPGPSPGVVWVTSPGVVRVTSPPGDEVAVISPESVSVALVAGVVGSGVLEATRELEELAPPMMHSDCTKIKSSISVTAALRAYKPPKEVTPWFTVMDVKASMLPLNVVDVPRVAEDPTCQKMLQACAPLISTTFADVAVVKVEPIWKTHDAEGSPCPSKVTVPVI